MAADPDKCKHSLRKCLNSRPGEGYLTRRRYKCHICGKKFSTIEVEVELQRGHSGLQSLQEQYGKQPDYNELEKAIELLQKLRDEKLRKPEDDSNA